MFETTIETINGEIDVIKSKHEPIFFEGKMFVDDPDGIKHIYVVRNLISIDIEDLTDSTKS